MNKPNYAIYEALLNHNNVKTSEVCKAIGMNASTISHWKNGLYSPKNDKIELLAEYFHIAPWAFYSDDTDDMEWYFERGQGNIYEVAAGQGRINDGYETMATPDEDTSTIKIVGDSMYPVLHDGDIVTIKHQPETAPTDLTVIKINGDESTIKHVEVTETGVWVRAINKDVFEDRFYTVREVMTLPVTIIGKAIELRRGL